MTFSPVRSERSVRSVRLFRTQYIIGADIADSSYLNGIMSNPLAATIYTITTMPYDSHPLASFEEGLGAGVSVCPFSFFDLSSTPTLLTKKKYEGDSPVGWSQ